MRNGKALCPGTVSLSRTTKGTFIWTNTKREQKTLVCSVLVNTIELTNLEYNIK